MTVLVTVIPRVKSVSSPTTSSVNLGKIKPKCYFFLICPRYKPFGPSAAVCRPKKSFWEVMPTHCLPAGFEAPKKWNMDSANLDAYFTRSEEWDAMTAEEGECKTYFNYIVKVHALLKAEN